MLKFLLVVALVGLAVYLLVRASQRRAAGGSGGGGTVAPPAPKRPLGPDDDPDFLWKLDRQKRHQRKPSDPTPPPETTPPAPPADETPVEPPAEPEPERRQDDDTSDRRTGEA